MGVALTSVAAAALADPYHPTDQEKAAARPIALEGLELASKGDCQGAVERLVRAEALVHAPTTAVPLAECEIKLGKVVLGLALLDKVIAEPLTANSPQPYFEAKQYAQQVRDAARARVAKLRIHVDAAPGAAGAPVVTLDGQPVASNLLDTDQPADPGAHHLVARQGALRAETDVTLADGQAATASLNLLGPSAPATVPTYAPPPAPASPPPTGAPPAPPPPAAPLPAAAPPAPPPPAPGPGAPPPPAAPEAAGADLTGFELSARLAVGLPFGNLFGGDGDVALSDYLSSFIAPLWLEAGYRIIPHLDVQAYFMFGPASLGSTYTVVGCGQGGVSCGQSVTRAGVEAHVHTIPNGPWDPWFGLGAGYEWVGGGFSNTHGSFGLGQSGAEFVNLQAGVDYRPRPQFGIGPFVSLSVGQYGTFTGPDANNADSTQTIDPTSIHEWLMIGVRGDFVVVTK